MSDMDLRHPTKDECQTVQKLVQTLVDEVYGGLWTSLPTPIGATDWLPSWIVEMRGVIFGVGLTNQEWLEDLWVTADMRGSGLGRQLLYRCEQEIRSRNVSRGRLRVVSSNIKAIGFYEAHGWSVEREYSHERFPVMMTDMGKKLNG